MASRLPAEQVPVHEHGRFLSGYAADRSFFTYRRCGACTALFCPVYYTPDQLGALYARQAENMADVPIAARRRTQQRYAERALRHRTSRGGFLEIGSDIGLFAAACARSGAFDHLWLFEPNVEVHDALRAAVGGTDHVISARPFQASDVPPQSVALAALVHVLDHLIDPEAMLAALHQAMNPGATLLVVTHDAGSALARVLGRRWPPYTLQHPQLFTRVAMRGLLERTGFSVVEQVASINDFPIGHLVRAALAVMGAQRPFAVWDGPLVPIRLGNVVTVARRDDGQAQLPRGRERPGAVPSPPHLAPELS